MSNGKRRARPRTGVCRACGCTEDAPGEGPLYCAGGCWWVEPDLCSTCAKNLAGPVAALVDTYRETTAAGGPTALGRKVRR